MISEGHPERARRVRSRFPVTVVMRGEHQGATPLGQRVAEILDAVDLEDRVERGPDRGWGTRGASNVILPKWRQHARSTRSRSAAVIASPYAARRFSRAIAVWRRSIRPASAPATPPSEKAAAGQHARHRQRGLDARRLRPTGAGGSSRRASGMSPRGAAHRVQQDAFIPDDRLDP